MTLENKHCDECTVPIGTRCESAPGNCPYSKQPEKPMTSIFQDQRAFMIASGQTVDSPDNHPQAALYYRLIREEFEELNDAYPGNVPWTVDSATEVTDALIDVIYVCSGMLHSMGVNPDLAFQEVQRSNMSKVDPETGKVVKRDDGKVLKPATYSPPDLETVVTNSWRGWYE